MKKKNVIFWILFLMCCLQGTAQKTGMQSYSMKHGENYIYETYFKWGLMMRAGEASFKYRPDHAITGATSQMYMRYKSIGFFDNFFKMRDTMSGYYSADHRLIFSDQRTHDGGYYAIDQLRFNYGEEKTTIHSYRWTLSRGVRIDTTLTAVGEVTDMLGVLFYLRGINRQLLNHGDTFPLKVAVGRDLVNVQFIYQNQMIVERDNYKFNTLYFKIDIIDNAFESSKSAAEVWVGDDDNLLPIKVRSKMKIGYVEVYFKSASELAHPLSCRIPVKK